MNNEQTWNEVNILLRTYRDTIIQGPSHIEMSDNDKTTLIKKIQNYKIPKGTEQIPRMPEFLDFNKYITQELNAYNKIEIFNHEEDITDWNLEQVVAPDVPEEKQKVLKELIDDTINIFNTLLSFWRNEPRNNESSNQEINNINNISYLCKSTKFNQNVLDKQVFMTYINRLSENIKIINNIIIPPISAKPRGKTKRDERSKEDERDERDEETNKKKRVDGITIVNENEKMETQEGDNEHNMEGYNEHNMEGDNEHNMEGDNEQNISLGDKMKSFRKKITKFESFFSICYSRPGTGAVNLSYNFAELEKLLGELESLNFDFDNEESYKQEKILKLKINMIFDIFSMRFPGVDRYQDYNYYKGEYENIIIANNEKKNAFINYISNFVQDGDTLKTAKFFSLMVDFQNNLLNDVDNILDNMMILSESPKELLQYQTHIVNLNTLFGGNQAEYTEQLDPMRVSSSSSFPSSSSSSFPSSSSSSSSSEHSILNSWNRKGGKVQTGGAIPDDLCNGKFLDGTDELSKQLIAAFGIAKTPDELHHDFKNTDSVCNKHYIDPSRMKEISEIYAKFTNIQIEKLESMEFDGKGKVIEYLKDLVTSGIISDTSEILTSQEWNYYTRTLKFVDHFCDNMGKLNITKFLKLSDSQLDPTSIEMLEKNGFIENITSGVEVGDVVNEKYIYISSDLSPVKPIFSISNVNKQFQDNISKFKCLKPLVENFEDNNENRRPLYTGPSMLDPSTIGPVEKKKFNGEDIPDELVKQKVQQLQDINENNGDNEANKIFKRCIENFISYFGVDVTITDLKFTEDEPPLKYTGISMNIDNNEYSLQIGDTTIKRISDLLRLFNSEISGIFIKYKENGYPDEFNKGLLPNCYVRGENTGIARTKILDSWKRIYDFGRMIMKQLKQIPLYNELKAKISSFHGGTVVGLAQESYVDDRIFTEIIISLKSMGDSMQVNYDKLMYDWLNNDGKQLFPVGTSTIDTYIGSTDKNVGAESLLIDSPFIINGTGIRPHMSLFNKNKIFYDSLSFNNFLKSRADTTDDENKLEYDTKKTITTNKGLMTIEAVYREFIDVYQKLVPYLKTKCFTKDGGDEPLPLLTQVEIDELPEDTPLINILDKEYSSDLFGKIIDSLTEEDNGVFNNEGRDKLIGLKTRLSDMSIDGDNNDNDIKTMTSIKAFISKAAEIVELSVPKYAELPENILPQAVPINETNGASINISQTIDPHNVHVNIGSHKRSRMFDSLRTITESLKLKYFSCFASLKQADLEKNIPKLPSEDSVNAYINKISNNIFEPTDWSKRYLNVNYSEILTACAVDYREEMVQAVNEVRVVADIFKETDMNTLGKLQQKLSSSREKKKKNKSLISNIGSWLGILKDGLDRPRRLNSRKSYVEVDDTKLTKLEDKQYELNQNLQGLNEGIQDILGNQIKDLMSKVRELNESYVPTTQYGKDMFTELGYNLTDPHSTPDEDTDTSSKTKKSSMFRRITKGTANILGLRTKGMNPIKSTELKQAVKLLEIRMKDAKREFQNTLKDRDKLISKEDSMDKEIAVVENITEIKEINKDALRTVYINYTNTLTLSLERPIIGTDRVGKRGGYKKKTKKKQNKKKRKNRKTNKKKSKTRKNKTRKNKRKTQKKRKTHKKK